MSFQARLVLGNNEYNVLDCEFDISQPTGRHNLPNHHTEVGLISLVVESSSRNELWEWGMSNAMKKSGSIVFYRRDAVSSLKTLEFQHAFCIRYKEIFNSQGSIPMRIYLTLSPFLIAMQGLEITQPWAGFTATATSSDSSTTSSPQNTDSSESDDSNESNDTASSDAPDEEVDNSPAPSTETETPTATTDAASTAERVDEERESAEEKAEEVKEKVEDYRKEAEYREEQIKEDLKLSEEDTEDIPSFRP